MRLPKRFALSTLLVLMLIVASVFGYAQWRKQTLLAEIKDVEEQGTVHVTVSSNWFWPTAKHAQVQMFGAGGKGSNELLSRLEDIGVERIEVTYEILFDEMEKKNYTVDPSN